MSINEFFGTRTMNIKRTASEGLRPISRICSLSRIIQGRQASEEEKKSILIEKKTLEEGTYHKQNYETVMHKTVPFNLPSLIRIRVTDREGNSIEVIY